MKPTPLPESFLKARRELLLDHPFFGSLVMNVDPVLDPSCKTVWVDGKKLGINPEFFDNMERAEGAGVIAHEIVHCALEHHLRRGDRDPKLWNDAADYVVNPIVRRSGLSLPKGALEDPRFDGKGVEEVYAILKQEQDDQQQGKQPQQQPQSQGGGGQQGQQPQPGQGNGPAGKGQAQGQGQDNQPSPTGEVRDATGEDGEAPSPAEARQQADDWQTKVQTAVNNAKGQGNYPAELERLAKEILTPKVDWREQLRRFFQNVSRTDSTWMRPNRRFIGGGLYLPGMRTEAAGALVVGVDTSGSIGARLLEQFAGELNAIVEDTKPERVYVVYCDARVNGVEEFTADDLPITLRGMGGGGTSFSPVFAWVEEQGLQPDALVYLTDMYGSFPSQDPEYPVVWANVGNRPTAPFGEVIDIKETF